MTATAVRCSEQVRRHEWWRGPGYTDHCRNPARFRVDGVGKLGALYSDVPMCSMHRRKYAAAGYRSWAIKP